MSEAQQIDMVVLNTGLDELGDTIPWDEPQDLLWPKVIQPKSPFLLRASGDLNGPGAVHVWGIAQYAGFRKNLQMVPQPYLRKTRSQISLEEIGRNPKITIGRVLPEE